MKYINNYKSFNEELFLFDKRQLGAISLNTIVVDLQQSFKDVRLFSYDNTLTTKITLTTRNNQPCTITFNYVKNPGLTDDKIDIGVTVGALRTGIRDSRKGFKKNIHSVSAHITDTIISLESSLKVHIEERDRQKNKIDKIFEKLPENDLRDLFLPLLDVLSNPKIEIKREVSDCHKRYTYMIKITFDKLEYKKFKSGGDTIYKNIHSKVNEMMVELDDISQRLEKGYNCELFYKLKEDGGLMIIYVKLPVIEVAQTANLGGSRAIPA